MVVFIEFQSESERAPGGTLANAGSCIHRDGEGQLPGSVAGIAVEIDSLDLEAATSETVIAHEIGHGFGLAGNAGTLQAQKGRVRDGIGTDNVRYIGSAGVHRYHRAGGEQVSVPMADNVHWSGEELTGELMTPTAGNGTLSEISLGNLADLGYAVDYEAADDFSIDDDSGAAAVDQAAGSSAVIDHGPRVGPVQIVDPETGQVWPAGEGR